MIANDFYTPEVQGDYELHGIGDFDLEEGGTIPDLQLAVATWGTLNEARDNAILVTTWFSGTHQIWRRRLRRTRPRAGPRPVLHRRGQPDRQRAVDLAAQHRRPTRSPCRSSRTSRIGDDVVAQERLLREHFGIERLQLVVGGSMGAQQTYEWAVRFPDKVLRAAPIAGTAQNTPHDFLYTQALMRGDHLRPGLERRRVHVATPRSSPGCKRHAGIWAVMGFSTEFWKQEVWRGAGVRLRSSEAIP